MKTVNVNNGPDDRGGRSLPVMGFGRKQPDETGMTMPDLPETRSEPEGGADRDHPMDMPDLPGGGSSGESSGDRFTLELGQQLDLLNGNVARLVQIFDVE